MLRFYHQLSIAEAAQELRVTQGTIKSQTARGLDRMRELLGVDDPGVTSGAGRNAEDLAATWGLEIGT